MNISQNILATNALDSFSEIVIAPNPVTDVIQIQKLKIEGAILINIFDALGRKVVSKTVEVSNDAIEMNVSEIPKGVYYIQFNVDKDLQVKKFIKK